MRQVSAAPALGRDDAIDATRGIAMLAVAIFHVLRGFVDSGQWPETIARRFADAVAYGFHVQTFFLIAGFLAYAKARQPRFQLRRQLSLYYTYLLWSLASWALSMAMSGAVNHAVAYKDLLMIPVVPIQHFWFLLVLMVGTALLAFLRTPAQLLTASVATFALFAFLPLRPIGIYSHLVYIFIGAWLAASSLRPRVSALLGAVCFLVLLICAWRAVHHGAPTTSLFVLPAILGGCYAVFVAGTLALRTGPLGRALAYCGRHSLPIFLLHVIAGAGTRIILYKLAPGLDLAIAISLSLIAAVIGPLVIDRIAERTGTATLLGLRSLPISQAAKPVAAAT